MTVDLSGRWTLESSDTNYEAYVDALGVDDERKQRMLAGKPTIVICQTADVITLTYEDIGYSASIQPGIEKEYILPDGTKGTSTWVCNKLVTRITGERGRTLVSTREIKGGKFVQTSEIDAIKTVRTFQKV